MADLAEVLTRKAPAKSTWDAANRTLEVRASTFADVARFRFIERLSSEPSAWDLSRVSSPAGVPLLSGHNGFDLDAKLGVVTAVQVRRDGLIVTVKLSDTDPANRLVRDIEAGIGAGVSIGYTVSEWLLDESGDTPIRTATAITLLEVSVVSVAADPGAAVRSLSLNEDNEMNDTPDQREFGPAARAALAEKHGLGGGFLRRYGDASEIEFRAAALDAIERRQDRHPIQSAFDPNSHNDDVPLARALGEALYARVTHGHTISKGAQRYQHAPLSEMARICLDRAGRDTRGTTSQLIERAMAHTTDFPALLSDATGRTLRAAYEASPVQIKAICRRSTATNFKPKHALQFSGAPKLVRVNEAGEFTRGSFSESKASYRLQTFGRVFAATRQSLINDDLGAFSDVPRRLAQAAAAFEADFLSDLLESNPTMGDGVALFHADHANIAAAGAVLSETSLSAARLAMSRQVGLAGELVAVRPKYLVVPPELETTAEKVLTSIAAAKTADANPFAGALSLLVEPRLQDPKAWYLSASPDQIDTIEYAYLESEEGPQLFSREGFDVDGIEFKVRLDFGAGAIDHRGLFRNAGA